LRSPAFPPQPQPIEPLQASVAASGRTDDALGATQPVRDAYDELTRDELIAQLRRVKSQPRLGLVWERDEIEHDSALNQNFVVCDLDLGLSSERAPFAHLVIEGDNFDSLRFLRMTHAGKVRCIFIDPPYNTGGRGFVYNNRFISQDDRYRHSTWLEFMFRRLTLARDLLTDDGVIFVSIDDNEHAHLALLMDQVLPGMRVATFVWKHRYASSSDAERYVGVDHEYILCYANPGFSFKGSAKSRALYTNPDHDLRGDWQSADLRRGFTRTQRPNLYYPLRDPATDTWYPCDPDQVWRYATAERLKAGRKVRTQVMEDWIAQGRILWPEQQKTARYKTRAALDAAVADGTAHHLLRASLGKELDFWVGKQIGFGTPRVKRYWSELRRADKPVSTWIGNSQEREDVDERTVLHSGFAQEGTRLLADVLGQNDFDYPKPLSLIMELVRQATDPDDTVLDFFAGSGTTGHAVLALNSEDGGSRRFILASSTEATEKDPDRNLCRDVLRERVQRVITGYQKRTASGYETVEGLGGTLGYLRTRTVPFNRVGTELSHSEIWTALQLLNGLPLTQVEDDRALQRRAKDDGVIAYVTQLTPDVVAEIEQIAEKTPHVIVYSWEAGLLRQHLFAKNVVVHHIPRMLTDRFGSA